MAASAPPPSLSRRNFCLGQINGPVTFVAITLMSADTVLAAFVVKLMGGNVIWVGLLSSVIASATLLPNAYLAARLEALPRRLPYYRLGALLRTVARLVLAGALLFPLGLSPLATFVVVTCAMLGWGLAAGMANIPFWSVVSDSIPPQWRGRFFGLRNVLSGLLAVACGLWVKHMLAADSGLTFPRNFGIIALVAVVAEAIGTGAWCLARERPAVHQSRRLSFAKQLLRGPRLLRRDPNYRRLLRANVAYSLAMSCTVPFIVPYALRHMGVAVATLGIFIVARQAAFSGFALVWGRLSDRAGNRRVLVITSSLALLLPLAMLAARWIAPDALLQVGAWSLPAPVVFFAAVFALVGLASGGLEMASGNYLLEVAPARKRSTYLGFSATIGVPLAWAPFAASLLIGSHDRFGLGFAVSLVAAVVCLASVLRMAEVRGEGTPPPPLP